MLDTSKVLEVLREARGIVATDWGRGSTNLDVPFEEAAGWGCASIAISTAVGTGCAMSELSLAAHRALLQAAGREVPEHEGAIVGAVYAFNDAQESRQPVLAAFDRAMDLVEDMEPTPEADELIEVMNVCNMAAVVVARHVIAARPDLPSRDLERVVSAELFYAAQDAAEACLNSFGVES